MLTLPSSPLHPNENEELALRIERAHSLAVALLFDLAAWLEASHQAVSAVDYRLKDEIREIPDPRQRLARYLSPALLASWQTVLDGWLASGFRLLPEFSFLSKIKLSGLGAGEMPRAVLRLRNRSVIQHGSVRQPCDQNWLVTVTAAPDLVRIETVSFEPESPGGA